jgi:hypothetical protein
MRWIKKPQRAASSERAFVPALQALSIVHPTWAFSPGFHSPGFQPDEVSKIQTGVR